MFAHSAPTVRQALDEAARQLSVLPDPRREAEWLLADVLSRSRAWLFTNGGGSLEMAQWYELQERVARRAVGEPLAYVLEHCDFRTLTLQVSPQALIPRPETEWLVEEVLKQSPHGRIRVVDLGTGSGAIALSLAKERPDWQIWATDVSTAALGLARRNAETLGLGGVHFLSGSWFDALPPGLRFEVVISNPPYVAPGTRALDEAVAHHEPGLALYAEDRGMAALQQLITEAPGWLESGGLLALEHGYDQGAAVREAMQSTGYGSIITRRDLGGHERFTVARWKEMPHAG